MILPRHVYAGSVHHYHLVYSVHHVGVHGPVPHLHYVLPLSHYLRLSPKAWQPLQEWLLFCVFVPLQVHLLELRLSVQEGADQLHAVLLVDPHHPGASQAQVRQAVKVYKERISFDIIMKTQTVKLQ